MHGEVEKLIIAPHIDDDILGCGGILDDKSFVLYCGVEDFHIVSREERISEANAAAEILGHSYKLLEGNTVNSYEVTDLLDTFSVHINNLKPSKVYIPYPSYNQDHRIVYEAAVTALRPHDINHFVKEVLVYEQPHVLFWDHTHTLGAQFKPNYFISIDIERKLAAYEAMKSQVRSFRRPEYVESLARLRGGQSRCEYAEAFYTLRIVGGS